jgi:antitoxin component of MazEF toxin-antitoxin module
MTLKTLSRIRAIGGSLVVTIPKEIVKEQSLQEGELIKLEVNKIKIDGFGLLKGVGKFTRKDRMEDRF